MTDHRGWFRTDAVYGGELRVERPGFATTHSGLDTPIDLTLYRGRAFDLPTGFEVAESRRLPPGGLLVSEATWSRLADPGAFTFERTVQVKGREEPVSVYRPTERVDPG